jgi:hypothetical protein
MPGFLDTISSTFPAGAISDATAQHSRHIAIPARLWLYVLLFIGFVIFLLVLPVIWGIVSEAASSAAEKAAPGTFFLGLGVLFVGLVTGIDILLIVGASLAGLVIVGVIVDNYLGSSAVGPPHPMMIMNPVSPCTIIGWVVTPLTPACRTRPGSTTTGSAARTISLPTGRWPKRYCG